MKSFRSLHERLPLYFATVAVVPVLLFGLAVSYILESHVIESVTHELESHAHEVATGVRTSLQLAAIELNQLVEALDKALVEDRTEEALLLQMTLDHSGLFSSVYLLDYHDTIVNLASSDDLASRREELLGTVYSGHELFDFRKSRDAGIWTHTRFVLPNGDPEISLLVPSSKGILLGTLSLDHIREFNEHAGHNRGLASIAIIDQDGNLIKHNLGKDAFRMADLMKNPDIRRAIATGAETRAHLHEERYLLECTRLVRETGWVVHVALPKAVALSQVSQVRWLLLGASSGAIGLGLLFTLWFTRRFVRPISSLMEKTREIAAGRYDLEMPNYVFSELNDFAEQFRKMGTAVKERELQLLDTQSLLSGLVNSVEGVVWEMALDEQRYTFISQQAGKMFGYPPERWSEDPGFWRQCIHPEDRRRVIDNRLFCLERDVSHEEEYRVVRSDKNIVWVRELINVITLDDQTRVLRGIMIDVTKQRQAEQALREEEEKSRALSKQFEALLDTLPYRIDLRDRSLQAVWSNKRQFHESELDTLPSCAFSCTLSEQGQLETCRECPTAQCFVRKERTEGSVAGRENTTWFVRAIPILDEEGELDQVIQIVENITDKLQKEQQEIRTGQLAALGELAAGVAHEINNPINGIINYAQLLQNGAAPGGREKDLTQRIIKEGDRIATIVRELLHFSREESTEIHRVAISDIVNEVLSLVGAQLHKEGVRLVLNLQDDLPLVESRSHQIEQSFLNLVSNARHALNEKFAGHDPDKILEIRAERVNVDGRATVRVTFLDRGPGIPADLLKRVLNPFVTTKPSGVGTGLGLSITHELVKKHDGTLRIESQEGEFTRVTIELPAAASSRKVSTE